MTPLRVFYHLARADFLERARRYSFLGVLAAVVFLGFSIIRGDIILRLNPYTGVPNSAWIGGLVSSCAVLMISLFGFYVVKNAVARDQETGVGQIIATSPLSRSGYLLGKWLSNWLVLSALVGTLAVAAVIMQMMSSAHGAIDIGALVLPFVLLALPAMAVVAALALLFECIPGLRGGWGNVAYFFLWSSGLSAAFVLGSRWLDWSGVTVVQQSMGAAVRALYPAYNGTFNFTSGSLEHAVQRTFTWSGIDWTAALVASRVFWIAGAAAIALAGVPFFHRFDPARERRGRTRSRTELGADGAMVETLEQPGRALLNGELHQMHLYPLPAGARRRGFTAGALIAELRLLVKGQSLWWYAGAAACIIAGIVSPLELARRAWLPVAWIWPLLIWSGIGTREEQYQTSEILFSSPHPILRQLPWTWMSGFLVAAATGSGVAVNLLVHGAWGALGAWCAGALFIPSLALALGIWSRTSRLFEIVYLLLWYLGPLHAQDVPRLDYMGVTDLSIAREMPLITLCSALLLFAVALLGRWRQLHR